MARRKTEDTGLRRTKRLSAPRLTEDEEAEVISRAAKVLGDDPNLAEYTRLILLSDLKAPAPSARDSKALFALAASLHRVGAELNRLHTEVRRIGLNVNQLAHAANDLRLLATSRDAPDAWQSLLSALSTMEALPTERKLRELAEIITAALEQPAFRAAPLKVIEAVEKVIAL
jgi:hypothetical protein